MAPILNNLKWDADCSNLDPAAAKHVEDKIAGSKVYLIGLTYCGWCTRAKSVIQKMGFDESDIEVDELDTMDNKMEIINYAYCKYSQMKTVPQIFINKKFVGGYTEARHYYYTGQGVRAAYKTGAIPGYYFYLQQIKQAAIDFVDEGTARSKGKKYFVLSKTRCPHCFNAKNCLKEVGVTEEDIELFEINDFYTHDEIKKYKGRIAETTYTPYLAFDGKTLYNHEELVKASGCSPLHYGTD
ncbi:uncharacterized protein LOC134818794 [Bolinopsis microptera]|uniref:uncharacterized protein LOC134818794 n=1 Tax=Bolinopsis microptera TaxID=2820187 RepID=UPI003078ACC9